MGRQDFERLLEMLTEPYGWERALEWLSNENEHSLAWFLAEFRKQILTVSEKCIECDSTTTNCVGSLCEACRIEIEVEAAYQPKAHRP